MNKFYIMADPHGSFKPFRDFYNRIKNTISAEDKITIIVLGDFGANFFFNYRDEDFKKKLGTYPFEYFIIRGNHEERPSICAAKEGSVWHVDKYAENVVYVENAYPYIKYALDFPATYEFAGHRTLVVPGAYSVDKYKRLSAGWSWFENEQLTENEKNIGKALVNSDSYDLILSHTAPICYEPTDLFLSVVDQSMVEKDMERYLGYIEYAAKYKVFMWGHYHQFREYPRNIGVPTFENPRQLMVYQDHFVELEDVVNNPELVKKI